MPMSSFHSLFPELAAKETRSVFVQGRADLPDGEYGFIELYCDEANCDCRRVMINVYSPATKSRILATINYGWESVQFYKKWLRSEQDARQCAGASLDPLNPQTVYAPALLELFKFVVADKAYVERLQRHYRLFKDALKSQNQPKRRGAAPPKRSPRRRK